MEEASQPKWRGENQTEPGDYNAAVVEIDSRCSDGEDDDDCVVVNVVVVMVVMMMIIMKMLIMMLMIPTTT